MHGKFDDLGRFADPSLLILTSLSDGPKHGYAIMTDVTAFSGVSMEPGTLYGALSRLERRGLGPAAGHRGTPPSLRDHRGGAGNPGRAGEVHAADRADRPAARRHRMGCVMRPGLADRLSRFLVGRHPRRWRDRYSEEMLDVLDQHQPTVRTVASLGASAVSAHLDPAYRTGRLSLARLRRAGLNQPWWLPRSRWSWARSATGFGRTATGIRPPMSRSKRRRSRRTRASWSPLSGKPSTART